MDSTGRGAPDARPLHVYWLVDASGSMAGRNESSTNQMFMEWRSDLLRESARGVGLAVTVRVIRFGDRPEWHVGPEGVGLPDFAWRAPAAAGDTATAGAIRFLADFLVAAPPPRDAAVACILASDGFCSEPHSEYLSALGSLREALGAHRAYLAAVVVGDDSECGAEGLECFAGRGQDVFRPGQVDRLTHELRAFAVGGEARWGDFDDGHAPGPGGGDRP